MLCLRNLRRDFSYSAARNKAAAFSYTGARNKAAAMLNPLQISSEPFYAMPKESPTRFT